jgi:phosphohistidine phosphatase
MFDKTFVSLGPMKKLYLVRHAKSSWDDYSLPDEKRPLNNRGLRDAPVMAKILAGKAPDLSWLITSPAKRARSTAKYFCKALDIPKKYLNKDSRLYHAAPLEIMNVVKEIEDDIDEAAIFGHNPGMTEFLNRYADANVDNLPTCGIGIIHFDVNRWQDADVKKGVMTEFLYPKKYGLL